MTSLDRDPERMNRDELLDYCYGLEARVQSFNELNTKQAIGHLQQEYGLTTKEAEVLAALSDGRLYTKESLLLAVYSDRVDEAPELKIVDVFICKVRRKTMPKGVRIETVWGSGYKLSTVDAVKAVMRGEGLTVSEPAPRPSVGRPAGDAGRSRPHGAVMADALAHLRSLAVDGKIEVLAKDVSRVVGTTYGGATVLRNLERSGRLRVLAAPPRGNGRGFWAVELVEDAA